VLDASDRCTSADHLPNSATPMSLPKQSAPINEIVGLGQGSHPLGIRAAAEPGASVSEKSHSETTSSNAMKWYHLAGCCGYPGGAFVARTVINLDEDMVTEAMRIFGTKTKAKAVRLAMEDAVKRHLRQEGFDAMEAGELDFSEIVENTGPRNTDGTLKRRGGQAA
jgi:Arc/MetJ family transcription regulator